MLDQLNELDFQNMPVWVWIIAAVIGLVVLVFVFKTLKTVFWPIKILLSLLSTVFTVAVFLFLLYSFGIIKKGTIDKVVDQYLPSSGINKYADGINQKLKQLSN